MKRYNILHPFIMSFFSKDLYRDVMTNWKGCGFAYLFLLLVICWIPSTFHMHSTFNSFINTQASKYIEQIPTITLKKGELSIDKPEPYFIKIPGTNELIGIIDTTGKITAVEKTKAEFLLTKTSIQVKEENDKVGSYTLPKEDYVLKRQFFYSFAKTVGKWGAITLYLPLLLASFIYRILQILIYAAIGTLIFTKILSAKFDYKNVVRLTSVSITPAIVLATVLDVFNIDFGVNWLLCFIAAMVYLLFAMKANVSEAKGSSLE